MAVRLSSLPAASARRHQAFAGVLCARRRIRAVAQAAFGQLAVHTIGEQHEGVAHLQIALHIVDHEAVLHPHGAQQLVVQIRVVDHVVVREPQRLTFAQQVTT
jgi:hypothetical protein